MKKVLAFVVTLMFAFSGLAFAVENPKPTTTKKSATTLMKKTNKTNKSKTMVKNKKPATGVSSKGITK